MANKTESGISLTSIIIGIGIGAILVYLYLKNRNPTMTLQNQQLNQNYGLIGLQQRMDLIEQKLELNREQLQQPISTLPITTYKNTEITEYVKDRDGDIIKKIVTRDADIK